MMESLEAAMILVLVENRGGTPQEAERVRQALRGVQMPPHCEAIGEMVSMALAQVRANTITIQVGRPDTPNLK